MKTSQLLTDQKKRWKQTKVRRFKQLNGTTNYTQKHESEEVCSPDDDPRWLLL